ncbi:MAG: motility associated factor glycosyltransferase family protein, partial [Nitrospirota bacterium]|nr:motility associated factor glycosyltransferase family protein [Nitrospirota bacterium]
MTTYENHLEALDLRHPELAALLGTDISMDHIQVAWASSGAARLLVTTESGVRAVHNEEDPEAVADRTVDKLDLESGVTVLLGMGLGYLAKALAARLKPGVALLVYEADPGIFKTALQLHDLTEFLSSPRVKVLVGPAARLESECYRFLLLTGGTVRVARAESSFRLAPDLYKAKYEKELLPFLEGALTNMFTVGRFGPLFTKNLLEGIPHIALSSGVIELRDLFAGIPAILVAAGPSLEKNVCHVKEAKGRAVIICADTVLGYLLEREIVPDFVVSVDGQTRTYDKYENVDIPPDIALVYHPACNDSIFKHFPGPMFAMSVGMLAYKWIEHCWPDKGSIESDTQCQMHLGFNLAEWMGCNPIVIVGQDLCCTDNLMHVRGGSYLTPEEEAQHVEKGHRTENIFGEPVRAYPNFLIYKATFERKIRESRARCIHATEGGLKLEGAEIRRLADVVEEYCTHRSVDVPSVLRPLRARTGSPAWDVLIEEVQGRERDLYRLERVSTRLCRVLEEIAVMRKEQNGVTSDLERLTQQA